MSKDVLLPMMLVLVVFSFSPREVELIPGERGVVSPCRSAQVGTVAFTFLRIVATTLAAVLRFSTRLRIQANRTKITLSETDHPSQVNKRRRMNGERKRGLTSYT